MNSLWTTVTYEFINISLKILFHLQTLYISYPSQSKSLQFFPLFSTFLILVLGWCFFCCYRPNNIKLCKSFNTQTLIYIEDLKKKNDITNKQYATQIKKELFFLATKKFFFSFFSESFNNPFMVLLMFMMVGVFDRRTRTKIDGFTLKRLKSFCWYFNFVFCVIPQNL